MLYARVQLLSDYAEQYLEKGARIQKEKGLWGSLIGAFKGKPQRLEYQIPEEDYLVVENLEERGFAKFCRINKVTIYLRKNDQKVEVAIAEKGNLWDISDWGHGYSFITRFIAECYFMVTKDDMVIDQEEQKVLLALFGCLEPSHQEILEARNLVYWTLIAKVIEDDIVTDEEKETMAKIRETLSLTNKNVDSMHKEALKEHYLQVKESDDKDTPQRLEKIKTMAKRLDISAKIFE
jgi:hypothetical protein